MIKRIETWLRSIVRSEFVPLKTKLSAEIHDGLVVIETNLNTNLTQHLNELSEHTTNNVADAIVRLQHNVECEVQKMKHTVDGELHHHRASKAQRDADEMLRHPRHKRN